MAQVTVTFTPNDLFADWEIIDVLDDNACCEECRPELNDPSEILTADDCCFLQPFLPARVRHSPWNLIYSSSLHGYGLNNLYRKAHDLDAPTLFVIKDLHDHVFGAIIPCPPRHRFRFEGNGECCVFESYPQKRIYPWCGQNYNIVMGDNNGISIGCENGSFALWLDRDLNRGRTSACETFRSDPLCPCGDFFAKTVELWSF